MPEKTYYLTTPIYYVNAVPHVGHALTMLVCDVIGRTMRMRGREVKVLTGTDENGTKVLEAAEKAGKPAQQFVDEISASFRDSFVGLNLQFDDFIRTTEPRHKLAVAKFVEILRERGAIYPGTYEGWYDVSAETFVRESDLVDGKSPEGNEVQWVSEENWFFKLSAFEKPLLDHIDANPDFLLPETRKNEVVSFIKQGLRDMCISRQNPGWGIPLPWDESKVVYVWFDALINYLSATGWPGEGWDRTWPADAHWMAKEIFTRFHATLWPAMLMAADLPLPKHVIAHGWFLFGEDKMSKSKGNVVAPMELASEVAAHSGCTPEVAVDAVRFSLAALLPYEGDTNYSREAVFGHYNSDLANDLGNALNRSLAMAHKFVCGVVPEGEVEAEAASAIGAAKAEFEASIDAFRVDRAVDAAWGLVRFLNKYIDTRAPWALAKSADAALPSVIRSMLACLRAAEGLVRPVVPHTADCIAAQLGLGSTTDWATIGTAESLPGGTKLAEPQPIFPRMDLKKIMDELQPNAETEKKPAPAPRKPKFEPPSEISIEDFMKVQLRVGRVLEAEPLEGSDKLLKLQVIIGDERRQILAGIKKSYEPEDLIGRQVIVVANLKPAKLMGHESQGMLLAADSTGGGAIFLTPESEAPEGSLVH